VNDRIRASKIRAIYKDPNTEKEYSLVLTTRQALDKAKSLGLDLVEVAPNADPPVCRICDFGKFKYDQKKQAKESPKHRVKTKEIKFRVGIGTHDYNIKMTRAENFLSHGDKLRMQLQFRGRENAHKDLGFVVMNRVVADLAGMAKVDIDPKLSGRQIVMMMSPLPPEHQTPKFNVEDLPDEIDLEQDDSHIDDEDDDHDFSHKDDDGVGEDGVNGDDDGEEAEEE
jgi:translation initiation factor IF-3